MGVIRSDPFILISGDTVANVDLSAAVAAHRARRSGSDKFAVMTTLMKVARPSGLSRVAPLSSDLAIFVDPRTERLLAYVNTPVAHKSFIR